MADTQPPQSIVSRLLQRSKNKPDPYKKGRRFTVGWNNLLLSETYLAELEEVTLLTVDHLLGFRPAKAFTLPQEPFLRIIMNDYKLRKITHDDLLALSEPHVKLIRNAYIGEHADPVYEDQHLWKYETYLLEYKNKARQRLSSFLGYEPELQHSMICEIHLRKLLASDEAYLPEDELTETDLRMITIIKYREVLLRDGKAAADNSALPAIDVIARHRAYKN